LLAEADSVKNNLLFKKSGEKLLARGTGQEKTRTQDSV